MITQTNFLFRVAGILLNNDMILFQRNKKGDAWVLPGGRAEVNESTNETIVREFEEELGVQVRIERLISIIENFNAYESKMLHEFGLYYLVVPKLPIEFKETEFTGIEGTIKLTFRWISINDIDNYKIYPKVLKQIIRQIPKEIQHYINYDTDYSY